MLALTRYTLDRRPWHEVGILGKNSMFFAFPHFRLRRNYCGAALHTLFHQCFKSRFSSSKRRSGVAGPRLCLQTHWYTINLMSSDIKVCPPTFEVAFTCCGHQSFLSDRHALSMIWVPAREGLVLFLCTILQVQWTLIPPHPTPTPTHPINDVTATRSRMT